jgi:lipopolysaccharide/colanic/teichoic acid biosynthesis glycosyltransferase
MSLALKRLLDVCFASFGLVLFSPVMAYIAWRLSKEMGRPVFFRQTRSGKHGKPFQLIKFRTMRDAIDQDGAALPDAQRLTIFGQTLRTTSLDELPELWNVLKGEMSLVGPRPLLPEYMPLYSNAQAHRHDLRPGLTGWAQVNGRNALTWEEKFRLDLWYLENRSLWLDLKIIALTFVKVLHRDGIAAAGEATMPKFTGSQN